MSTTSVCSKLITYHGSNVVGQQLRYCGIGHQYDDVIIEGDPGAMKVSKLVEFMARKGDRKRYSS